MGKGSSSSFLLATLAVIDSCVLLFQPIYDWLYHGPVKFNIRTYSTISCKLSSYLFRIFPAMSSYNLITLSIFRAVGVFMPHKYKAVCTKKRAVILMGVIVIVISLAFVHNIVFHKLMKTSYFTIVQCNLGGSYFLNNILPNLQNTLVTYLPLMLIFLINISIIVKLACRKMGNQGSGSKITATLIAVSILYLITQTPMAVYVTFFRKQDWKKASPLFKVKFSYYWCIISNLSLVNNAGNFPLYCLTGARFRKQLTGIISYFYCCKGPPKLSIRRALSVTSDSVRSNATNMSTTASSSRISSSVNLECRTPRGHRGFEADHTTQSTMTTDPSHI